jgi:competence protein ComEC
LTWYEARLTPLPGELWTLQAKLRAPRGFANPGVYDFEAQMLRENTGATGYVREAQTNRRLATAHGYWVLRTRAKIAARLEAALPNSPMLGIVQGLTVGETSRMTGEQWRVFANTGTTHLMAISGMHIGMVALWIAWLAGRIARYFPLQRLRVSIAGVHAIVGMIAAVGYSALAGLSVPTQRTLIMLCVLFAARLLRREVAPTRGLALALIVILVVDPFAPLAAGFWLSFGAVAAIFLATSGSVVSAPTWREYGRLQIVATVGLAPLVIGTFGNLSLISPLVNLMAIPFFTLLMVPLVLVASALLFVNDWLGSFVLHLAVQVLDTSWPALKWASELTLAMWPFTQAPIWAFVLLLVGTFVILAPGVFATRLAGCMLCLPALFWQPSRPRSGEFELTLLDVGQGLAIVVTTTTHVLVYDTGPNFRGGRDTGELVVVPYLHARGVRRIDTLVASHGDADHIGGLNSVLGRIPTGRLLLGPSVEPRVTSEVCAAAQSWEWDGVRFEMVYPPVELRLTRRNDSSCVLRIAGVGGSAVLFGDIEKNSEQWLVEHQALAQTDIAVVPHHGSRTSSTAALISATAPQYALVSAGFGNQWGFPKADVLARWQAVPAEVLQTAQSGAIEVAIARNGVERPRAYREERRHYWHK